MGARLRHPPHRHALTLFSDYQNSLFDVPLPKTVNKHRSKYLWGEGDDQALIWKNHVNRVICIRHYWTSVYPKREESPRLGEGVLAISAVVVVAMVGRCLPGVEDQIKGSLNRRSKCPGLSGMRQGILDPSVSLSRPSR